MIQSQKKRKTTARKNTYYCAHCHMVLHKEGTISDVLGIPYIHLWEVDGAGRVVCIHCRNEVMK